MWFAFKFVFLYWLIQRQAARANVIASCDLLSNLYFCIGWYSVAVKLLICASVVICFQICIFVLVDTAAVDAYHALLVLWFAFKFVFLYWLIQHGENITDKGFSCDLLSNLYFCIGWYSHRINTQVLRIVVICFQICIFVLVDTAFGHDVDRYYQLWFAFKFVFLYWLIQRRGLRGDAAIRCDLLSNLYFCIGWYSRPLENCWHEFVVICFQICIFVLVDTAQPVQHNDLHVISV